VRLARAGGPPRDEARALERVIAAAIERATPSVVRIRPAAPAESAASVARKSRTGVAIEKDLVVTDALSVGVFGVDELVVETFDGKSRKAKLRGRDLRLRLVVVEVPEGGLVPIARAAPAPEAGTLAIALGAVLDPARPSATFGIVSAASRFEGRALETDATIDPSDSGGPLVDVEGRALAVSVIVDRRIGDGSGVGFAVPFSRIEPILPRLRKGDELEAGFLGVTLPDESAPERDGGVRVDSVRAGGPAAKAGIQAGDVILALDLEPGPAGAPALGRVTSVRALGERLSCAAAGDKVRVTLRRGLEERTLDVTLGRRDTPR
jgi:S1-C subfamily serine protease